MVASRPIASEPRGIADGFDVRVLVDVDPRADGNALRQILAGAGHAHPDERFGIGAHALAQLVADARQRAFLLSGGRARSRVPSEEAENTTPRQVKRRRCRFANRPWTSPLRLHSHRCRRRCRPAGEHPPLGFREKLRRRASPPGRDSSGRACSWRRGGSPSCSRRSRCRWCAPVLLRRNTGRDRSGRQALLPGLERCRPACGRRSRRRPQRRRRFFSRRSAGPRMVFSVTPSMRDAVVVMRRHLRFPVGQAGPGSVVPDFVRRAKQRIGVGNGSAADRTAVQDGDMPEEAHVEEAAQRQAPAARTSDGATSSCAAGSPASSGGPSP